MTSLKENTGKSTPWLWVPTLYFAEGIPYFAVNALAVLLYTQLDIPIKEMAFFTSLLSLPWAIKPFWAPIVDIMGTKRKWVIIMEIAIALCLGAIAFLLNLPFFFATTLAVFFLMAFFSATHDIAADGFYMLGLTHHQQASYSGLRNTFYRISNLFSQGAMVALSGILITVGMTIKQSWFIVFIILGIIFFCIAAINHFLMPKPSEDAIVEDRNLNDILKDFIGTFATFFRKKHLTAALAFMLFYRLPEALLTKLTMPFFKASCSEGGLELDNGSIGIAYGTVGVIALLAGGIIGGICIGKGGLKKWLWPMALSLTIPSGFYCYLAMVQPDSLLILSIGVGIEQFGYGFGFTAFMLYLIYFSEGEYKTSCYAFCTGIMALGMMLPGMAAGWIYEKLSKFTFFATTAGSQGYVNFFWFMMLCSVVTFIVCAFIHIPADFGKKTTKQKSPPKADS